jgi:hypothetical protein
MNKSLVICFFFCFGLTLKINAASLATCDLPDEYHPWAVHDENRPQPPMVTPGDTIGDPSSDAVVLFDGSEKSLANWKHARPKEERKGDWKVVDGALVSVAGAGYLETVKKFGNCQLHVEWAAPTPIKSRGQGRGNSGVFLPGKVEVQVLDSYNNPTYADGAAGAVYGVMPPAVLPLRPPGEWQTYDIIYRRPIVRDGVVLDPGSMTVLVNGVVVQDNTPLEGGGGSRKRKPVDRVFPEVGSLRLQDHGNPVRYRNIWCRPLRLRAVEGGFDGRLSPEATMAKRREIASVIREDAMQLEGFARSMRLLESLAYDDSDDARVELDRLVLDFLEQVEASTVHGQAARYKNNVLELDSTLRHFIKFDRIDSTYFALSRLSVIMQENEWKHSR